MKYLYKQTGIIVESSSKLDSFFFYPIENKKEVQKVDARADQHEEVKNTVKKTVKRTTKK